MDQTGQDGLPRHHGRRHLGGNRPAKPDRSRRPARRRAERRLSGIHLYGTDAGPVQYGRRVRTDRAAGQSGRFAGATPGRRAGRTRRTILQHDGLLPGTSGLFAADQPVAGQQCRRGRQAGQLADERPREIVPGRRTVQHGSRLDAYDRARHPGYRHDAAVGAAARRAGHLSFSAKHPGHDRAADCDSGLADRSLYGLPAVRILNQRLFAARTGTRDRAGSRRRHRSRRSRPGEYRKGHERPGRHDRGDEDRRFADHRDDVGVDGRIPAGRTDAGRSRETLRTIRHHDRHQRLPVGDQRAVAESGALFAAAASQERGPDGQPVFPVVQPPFYQRRRRLSENQRRDRPTQRANAAVHRHFGGGRRHPDEADPDRIPTGRRPGLPDYQHPTAQRRFADAHRSGHQADQRRSRQKRQCPVGHLGRRIQPAGRHAIAE